MEMDLNHNLLLVDASGEDSHQLELWLNFAELACLPSTVVTDMAATIGKCTFPFSQHAIIMVDSIIRESSNILGRVCTFCTSINAINTKLSSIPK